MRDPVSGHGTPAVTTTPIWQRLVIGKNPKITLVRAVILGLACWLTFRHVLLPVRVVGISMEPTLHDGSVNLVNRLPFLWREPQRGEIVALRTTGMSVMYLKRIIALPRETLEIKAGRVLIDGQPLDEPYLTPPQPWELKQRVLGGDEYAVIGDNRTMPMELHWAGVVKRSKIVGKAVWSGKPSP
jgi:signal peptidase I